MDLSTIFLALSMLSLGLERFVAGWEGKLTGLLCIVTGVLLFLGK